MTAARTLYLGFDVGTQSTKALLLDVDGGGVVARAQRAYGLISGLPPGHAEQDPATWITAVKEVAREVLRDVEVGRVGGVGVSGQQHGCVVLGDADEVVRPAKLWCDTSTTKQARALSDRLGRVVPVGFTASKLVWLRECEPNNWDRVRSVLLPHDYINFRLTGVKTMECGDASGTGLFDVAGRVFDQDAVSAVDSRLSEMLPPLLETGEPAGELSATGAALLGLPVGLPVAAGGGDNMMAAIGAGATRSGVVVMSLGTSGTVFTRTDRPVVDPDGLIAPFCSSDGGWLPLLCVMNATGVTEEVRAAFGLGHDELTRLAGRVPTGCDGVTWLPFLQGERVPDLPSATGSLLGLRAGQLRPGLLYRAALEGVSCNLAQGVARMQRLGLTVSELRLVGGAACNPLWRQILADLLSVPVAVSAEPEAAALGAAIAACWTSGRQGDPSSLDRVAGPLLRTDGEVVEPDPDNAAAAVALLATFGEAMRQQHGVC